MPGIGGVQGIRQQLLQATAARRMEEQKELVHQALITAVAERVDADIPASAIRQLAENEYQAKLHEYQLKEQMTWDEVNQLATEPMLNHYLESRREDLVIMQKATLGMQDMFKREGLQVTEEMIRAEISAAVRDFEKNNQEYDKARLREQVVEVLEAEKVIQWLEDNVIVTIQ